MTESKGKKIFILILILLIASASVLLIFMGLRGKGSDETGKISDTVTYATGLPFEPQDLKDITETEEGDTVRTAFLASGTEVAIPPKSRIILAFNTACLDSDYGVPDETTPVLLSYEMLDMPLFWEIEVYAFAHPEMDRDILQSLLWYLSSRDRFGFDEFGEDEQALLLEIDPDAQEIIDSYKYQQDISVKNFSFGEDLPEEIVAQSVPGTALYAKVIRTDFYDYTEIEIYNPSDEPQTFSLLKEGVGVLSLVPQGWVKFVEIGDLNLGVEGGKFSVIGETIRTPADSGVILVSEDGERIFLNPSSELSSKELQEIFGEQTSHPLFIEKAEAEVNWEYLIPKRRDKFQMKQPTSTTGRRG